jgi:hypothetical protein
VTLVLQAVDMRGPSRWRWLLTDEESGQPLADHQVVLEVDAARLRAFGGGPGMCGRMRRRTGGSSRCR